MDLFGLSVLPESRCVSFPRLGRFLAVISSNKLSAPFSSSWNPCNAIVSRLDVMSEVLKLPSLSKILFLFSFGTFHYSVFQFADYSSVLSNVLLIPSS